MRRVSDRVALVTGASRGCGKGVALVLGEKGWTVYLTGRSVRGQPATLGRPGTIDDTAEQVTARGGTGIVATSQSATRTSLPTFSFAAIRLWASAAAEKKCPRLFHRWAFSTSTSRT